MDVREHAAGRDGHAAQELVQLLVVADGELDVARDDARLLVVAGRVAWRRRSFATSGGRRATRALLSSARVERRTAPRHAWRTLRDTPRERTPLGAGELEDLGAEVLEDGAHVDARRGGHAGRAHLAQVAREARAGELQARLRRGRRAGLAGLALAAATLSFACGGRTVFLGAWRGATPPAASRTAALRREAIQFLGVDLSLSGSVFAALSSCVASRGSVRGSDAAAAPDMMLCGFCVSKSDFDGAGRQAPPVRYGQCPGLGAYTNPL